jgi:NCS1 family nucleobase:cation symporter-1
VTAIGTELPTEDTAFHVEMRGIDYVPVSERWAKPRDVAGMWAGASVQMEYLVYGTLLMTIFGLSFGQVVSLIIIGNLSYFLLGLCSLQGPNAGTTVFTISRASYGPNGGRLVSLFNWLTQVGFETEGLALIVFGAMALTSKAGFTAGTPAKVIFILLAAAVQMVLPFLGHATIVKTLRALIIPFIILYAILAVLTLGKADTSVVHHGADWQTWFVGLAFVMTLSGLGWAECGNDFTRYCPPETSKKGIVGWLFLGTAIPEILIMLLGAAVGTYLKNFNGGDPFSSYPHAFSSWFLVPFFIVAIIQLFAINSLDLYSSGVTLQALGLPVKRWQAVVVDTVIAGGITFYAVFSSSFSTLLSEFVDGVIVWIGPWIAIFLIDWALRRYRYVPMELQRTDAGGLYWRRGGIHWPAIIAQLAGGVVSFLALNEYPHYVGPIARAVGGGGADFSVFAGIIVGGGVYLVLAWSGVRREADLQDQMLAA